ncbi:MAG: glycosyltransferase family 92 protein [Pseudomonadota bacterium]
MNYLEKILTPFQKTASSDEKIRQWFPHPPAKRDRIPTTYLACCAIVRNEARYIREWIEFHRLVGVEKFLIYDNCSTDATREILRPYEQDGLVEVVPWPHFVHGFGTQALAYAHAVAYLGPNARWMAFIDIDEYLFSPSGRPISEILKSYEDLPALVVYWLMYGTSGRSEPGEGLMIEDYTMRAHPPEQASRDKILANYKSIVDPGKVIANSGAHHFFVDGNAQTGFDEKRRPVFFKKERRVTVDEIRINHYFTKSLSEWRTRYGRQTGNSTVLRDEFLDDAFAKVECEPIEDTAIWRYLPALQAAMDDTAPDETLPKVRTRHVAR